MTFTIRPARDVTDPRSILIGIGGKAGRGKTTSALILATEMAGGNRVVVIDTEGGRALELRDEFDFDYLAFEPPFSPERYLEAFMAALAADPGAVVVDSSSHAWDGEGGYLEQVDRLASEMADKSEHNKNPDSHKMAARTRHKPLYRHWMRTVGTAPVPVIMCVQAREKVEVRGKQIQNMGVQPILGEKDSFEFRLFGMLADEEGKQGVLVNTKQIRPLQDVWKAGARISPEMGKRLREWSVGKSPAPDPEPKPERKSAAMVTLWLPNEQRTAPAQTAATDLAAALQEARKLEDVDALEANNSKWFLQLKPDWKDRMETRVAEARKRAARNEDAPAKAEASSGAGERPASPEDGPRTDPDTTTTDVPHNPETGEVEDDQQGMPV